jgi:hypothetical protein
MGHIYTGLSGGKSEEKIEFGRPTRRWEDNIKMNLQEFVHGGLGACECSDELSDSTKRGEFLDQPRNCYFLGKDFAPLNKSGYRLHAATRNQI